MFDFIGKNKDFMNKKCKTNIYDLGNVIDSRFKGVYSVVDNQELIHKYLQEQFIENADEYHKKYTSYDHFYNLIKEALERISFNDNYDKRLNILDIGSGSGNTIIPLLNIFKCSNIIASDLSIELLYLLKKALDELKIENKDNLKLLQLNAEDICFEDNSFDLIVGGSILHHLFVPNKTLNECFRVLKKGGYAIFFEPFENGNMIIKCIFDEIINDDRAKEIDETVIKFLEAVNLDLDTRKGRDKSNPIFNYMDDKWIFTHSYFKECSDEIGFSNLDIYSLHKSDNLFENQIISLLSIGMGKKKEALPKWAWEKIKKMDNSFSLDMKKELLIEGCIILKK